MVTSSKNPRTTPPRMTGSGSNILPPTPDSTNYNPRKRAFGADPTYLPRRDSYSLADDAHDDEQMRKEAVSERPGRKVRVVDPTYNPKHEVGGDTDDETTASQVSAGKRKRADVSDKHPGTKRTRTFTSPSPLPTPSSLSEESGHGSRPPPPLPLGLASPTPVGFIGGSDDPVIIGRRTVTPSRDMPKTNRKGKGVLKPQKGESYIPLQIPSNQKLSLKERRRGADDGASDEEEEYTGAADVPKSEKKTAYDFSLERARRWAAAVSLPDTWSKAEKELFFRLAMRGFEPLLPQHWRHDFSTLPETLFSSPKNGRVPVIWPFKELDFHAIKSLGGLFALGGQVRDCSVLQNRPEVKIKQAINKYIKWALRDAGLQNRPGAIPTYIIHAQEEGEPVVAAVARLNRRLGTLCKRYQEAQSRSSSTQLQPARRLGSNTIVKKETEDSSSDPFAPFFPLLVGFVICGPIVAILTLDTDPLSPKDWTDSDIGSKFISQFDVGEYGQDVWTSLAVAITTMHIRQTMVSLAEDGGGFYRSMGDAS